MVSVPSYENLAEEVHAAVAAHYFRWVAEYPNEKVYAYVIYAEPLLSTFAISVLTERGLRQAAADYQVRYRDTETIEELERELRWSVADTPYCGDFQDLFDTVNQRLGSMMPFLDSLSIEDPAWQAHFDILHSALIEALRRLRREQLNDSARPLVYVDFGDMSDEERLWFIEQCNASDAIEWYRSSR